MNRKVKKIFASSILAVMMLTMMAPIITFATEITTIKKTYSYTTLNNEEISGDYFNAIADKQFPNEIIEDDKKFVLDGIEGKVDTVTSRMDTVSATRNFYGLYSKNEVPDTTRYDNPINGKSYQIPLKEANYTAIKITDRASYVTASVDYGKTDKMPVPEETIEVEFSDSYTGQKLTGTVDLIKVEALDEGTWEKETLTSTVNTNGAQFISYGSTGIRVRINEDGTLDFMGNEAAIVKAMGRDPETFRIFSGSVSGTTMTVNCEHLVMHYVAYYGAECKEPDLTGYNAEVIYEGEIDVLDGTEEYTVTMTATYTHEEIVSPVAEEATGFWNRIVKAIKEMSPILKVLFVLLLLLAVAAVVVIVKKRKESKQ